MANPKKPRTAKQKAATRRMIAARRAKLRGSAPKRNAKSAPKRNAKRNAKSAPKRNAKRNATRTPKQQAATRRMIAARRAQLRGKSAPKRNSKGGAKRNSKKNPKDMPSLLVPFDTWGQAGAFGGALAISGIAQHMLIGKKGLAGAIIRGLMDVGGAYGLSAMGMDRSGAPRGVMIAAWADIFVHGVNALLQALKVGSLELGAIFMERELDGDDLGAFIAELDGDEGLGAFISEDDDASLGRVIDDIFAGEGAQLPGQLTGYEDEIPVELRGIFAAA